MGIFNYGFRNKTTGAYVEADQKKTIRWYRQNMIERGDECSDIEYDRRPLAKIVWLGEEIDESALVEKFTSGFGDDREVDYDSLCAPMVDEAFAEVLDILSLHRDTFDLVDVIEAYLKIVEPDLVYGEYYRDYEK